MFRDLESGGEVIYDCGQADVCLRASVHDTAQPVFWWPAVASESYCIPLSINIYSCRACIIDAY